MDGLEQRDKPSANRAESLNESDNPDIQVIHKDEFIQVPESLHQYITPHKDAISTGLYYLSLGTRTDDDNEVDDSSSDLKEKNKTLRFKLSPLGRAALSHLIDLGYTKKSAVIDSIKYLQTKPQTILQVKL